VLLLLLVLLVLQCQLDELRKPHAAAAAAAV
jgi:hypothetical protein